MERLKKLLRCRFKAEGLSLERLTDLCLSNGIELEKIRRQNAKCLIGCVARADYPRLLELAQQRGWQVTQLGAVGAGKWIQYLKARWGLVIGTALMVGLVFAAMQFVWQIEIKDAGSYEGDIRQYLGEKGIGVAMPKKKLDLSKLAYDLQWRYPKTAWVYADLRGSTLVLRVVEGVPVPQVASYGEPGDVVAQRGGVVVSVEPMAGTAQVKPGEIVRKGQVLIRGQEKRGGDTTVQVKARGRVLARVWDQVRVHMPLWETLSEPTGFSRSTQWVNILRTPLGRKEQDAFEAQDTIRETWPLGGVWWPVTLTRETICEVKIQKQQRPYHEVEQQAKEAALRLLNEKNGSNHDFIDKWVDCCMIKGGILEVCATGEKVVDIAQMQSSPDP